MSSNTAASSKKRKTENKQPDLDNSSKKNRKTVEIEASIPLGKALASTEKRTRDAAIKSLAAFLSQNGNDGLSDLDMMKLWKGIFYCFWMSDKPRVQQALAQELADLVLAFPEQENTPESSSSSFSLRAKAGLRFLETFWDTMIREWSGLDKHRMDKFYLLVRRFVNAGFRLLATEKWSSSAVDEFVRILSKKGGVLSTNEPSVPDSITYHLSDIYLVELENAATLIFDNQHESTDSVTKDDEEEEEEEQDIPLIPILRLLSPFISAVSTCTSKAMYDRIMSNVIQPFLDDTLKATSSTKNEEEEDEEEEEEKEEIKFAMILALSESPTSSSDTEEQNQEEEEEEEEDDDDDIRPLTLRKAVFRQLLAMASRKEASEARRRNLYKLWRDEQDRIQ